MNISCSICAEFFKNSDASSVNVTYCGHVFHNVCLSKWLERSKTCPECRCRTTTSTIIRVYYNVSSMSDSSLVREYSGPQMIELQSEVDNLKFQLLEKNGVIKSKEDAIQQLCTENEKIRHDQKKSQKRIQELQEKHDGMKIIEKLHVENIKRLSGQLLEMDKLKELLDAKDKEINLMQSIREVLKGSRSDAEVFLKTYPTAESLATAASVFKNQLIQETEKRRTVKIQNSELQTELSTIKKEKTKLEERISLLESRLYRKQEQLKQLQATTSENKNEISLVDLTDSPVSDKPVDQCSNYSEFRRPLVSVVKTKKVASPYLQPKSSALAGLSKHLNPSTSKRFRPEIAESQLSIFRNPRLFQAEKHNLPSSKGGNKH